MVPIGLIALVAFLVVGTSAALAGDKHGDKHGGDVKASLDEHGDPGGGDKDKGDDHNSGDDHNQGSDENDTHGSNGANSPLDSDQHRGEGPGPQETVASNGASDAKTTKGDQAPGQDGAGEVSQQAEKAKDQVISATDRGTATPETAPSDVVSTATDAATELGATDAKSDEGIQQQPSPPPAPNEALATVDAAASLPATGNQLVAGVGSIPGRVTSTLISAAHDLKARVQATSEPVTTLLDERVGQLLRQPAAQLGSRVGTGAFGTSATTKSGSSSGGAPTAPWKLAAMQRAPAPGGLTATRAVSSGTGVGVAVPTATGLRETRPVVISDYSFGVTGQNEVSLARQSRLSSPPRAPPPSLPTFSGGMGLTLLFSAFFLALLATAGAFAPKPGLEALLVLAGWRPILFVSALERPG